MIFANPINYIDPLGLAPEDAYRVWNTFINSPSARLEYGLPMGKSQWGTGVNYGFPFADSFLDRLLYQDANGIDVTAYNFSELGAEYRCEMMEQFGMAGSMAAFLSGYSPSTNSPSINNAVRILEQADDVVILAGNTSAGELRVTANMSKEGGTLFLRKAHIEGPGPGTFGRKALWDLAKKFGRQQGVDRVVIEGGRRTTGKMISTVPRPIVIKVK